MVRRVAFIVLCAQLSLSAGAPTSNATTAVATFGNLRRLNEGGKPFWKKIWKKVLGAVAIVGVIAAAIGLLAHYSNEQEASIDACIKSDKRAGCDQGLVEYLCWNSPSTLPLSGDRCKKCNEWFIPLRHVEKRRIKCSEKDKTLCLECGGYEEGRSVGGVGRGGGRGGGGGGGGHG